MPYTLLHNPGAKARERLLLIGGFQAELYTALSTTPFLVEEVLDGKEALDCAAQRQYGVVLCSLRMAGAWGLDVLDAILRADALTPVIISTALQEPQVIVEAMRRGAFDYIIEPYADVSPVLRLIERAMLRRKSLREAKALRANLADGRGRLFKDIVGRSAALRQLCQHIRQVAPTPSPVLIEGESGTGKELVARALHEVSNRREGPFVAVHCGAIPENLLESELFGHEKGAFTGAASTRVGFFEEAHAGTLFLDEISLMSKSCQGKLLRVLEDGQIRRVGASREFKVDVRIVAAANEMLSKKVDSGDFRQDLFYRLNVVSLNVPALRERSEDIPLLCYHFAEKFSQQAGKAFEAFAPEALAAFCAYRYPGNVRELRNLVDRALVFSRGPVVGAADLPELLQKFAATAQPAGDTAAKAVGQLPGIFQDNALGLDQHLAVIEKALIEQALSAAKGNRTRAAASLKINRTTLLQKMTRLGLTTLQRSPGTSQRAGRGRRQRRQ